MKPCPIIIVMLLIIYSQASARSDTAFYDVASLWTKRSNAFSYRPAAVPEGRSFRVTEYYSSNNKLRMTGLYDNATMECREGLFIYYDTAGNISEEGAYLGGKKQGRWLDHDRNDSILTISHFRAGVHIGTDTMLYNNGAIKRIDHFENNKLVNGHCYDRDGKELAYYPYYVMPEFPGGDTGQQAYLRKNAKYPEAEYINMTEGRVYVRYMIDTDGSVSNVKIIRGKSMGIDLEALRIIQEMPRWKPGLIDNIPVKVWFTQAINFQLE